MPETSRGEYTPPEYTHEAIFELKEPIENILTKLSDKIESGYFNAIVGEDASGRIPALIIGRIISERYKKNSLSSPDLKFVAGSSNIDDYSEESETGKADALYDFFKQYANKNVLLVTEYIFTGESLSFLLKSVNHRKDKQPLNINFDIATVAATRGKEYLFDSEVQAGRITYNEPKIVNSPRLNGVSKFVTDLHSSNRIPLDNLARPETYQMADEILQEYEARLPQ